MEVRYDPSQDITLILTAEESSILRTAHPTNYYSDIHVSSTKVDPATHKHYLRFKGLCKGLCAYFLLGYSKDNKGIFENASELDNDIGKILIPDPNEKGSSWMINLSIEGLNYLKRGWPYGVRYNGSNKLFVIGTQNAMD